MPYTNGLSRGDTPTSIRQRSNPMASIRCPFHVDEDMPFSARSATMSMDSVRRGDVPPGPLKFNKDYDRCLITEDIPLAQPTLAHPSRCNMNPLPFQYVQKPPPAEVDKACPKTHYPEVGPGRPLDLSLTTEGIDYAQPAKYGRNSEGKVRADSHVDPLSPHYQLFSAEAQPPPTMRSSGKCTLDIADIEGTAPTPTIPPRRQFGDTLKNEDEFRTPFVRARGQGGSATARATTQDGVHPMAARPAAAQDTWRSGRPPGPGDTNRCCLTPTGGKEAGQRKGLAARCDDVQAPRYKVPLPSQAAGTSLHARFAEERHIHGDAPPATEYQELGHIPGSSPQTKIRNNGQPQLNLETRDIPGGRPLHRVGKMPYTIYGPIGNRPVISQSLNATDIPGARADTLTRGPRSTVMKQQAERHQEQQPATRFATNGAAVLSSSAGSGSAASGVPGHPGASSGSGRLGPQLSSRRSSEAAACGASAAFRSGGAAACGASASGTPRSCPDGATPGGHAAGGLYYDRGGAGGRGGGEGAGGAPQPHNTAELLQSTLCSPESVR